jgi:hypothetical protein
MADAQTLRGVAALLVLVLLALPLGAQKKGKLPPTAPEACTVCAADPERMLAGGIVSHGPFPFGSFDTLDAEEQLGYLELRWIETEHFRIGMAVDGMKVDTKDKKKVLAELERLAEVFPEVSAKKKSLDPWLRLHLYAQRCEDVYKRMLRLLRIEQSDLPDGESQWYAGKGKYMGEGPHMGQADRYELMVLPDEASQVAYLDRNYGLRVKMPQQWHVTDRGALTITLHTSLDGTRKDAGLHGNVAFNFGHLLLNGYQHWSYDLPVWLVEGTGHYVQRELDPRYNSFTGSEGATANKTNKSDWQKEALKLVKGGDAPRLAQLQSRRSFGELEVDDHITAWSMVEFLATEHPAAFALIIDDMSGRKDERGHTDSNDLGGAMRTAFKERLGMTYSQFDEAWAEWVRAGGLEGWRERQEEKG